MKPKRAYKNRGAPPVHGTRYTYTDLKCRCDACRACNAAYEKARRTRPREPLADVRFSIALRTLPATEVA